MKFLDWFKQWTIINKSTLSNYDEEILALEKDVEELKKENIELKSIKVEIKNETFELPKPKILSYQSQPLSNYFKPYTSPTLMAIVQDINSNYLADSNNLDSYPLAWMKWLKDKLETDTRNINTKKPFRYVHDSVQYKKQEHWATPEETLKSGLGDCDDFMILGYAILRELFRLNNKWEEAKDRLFGTVGGVNSYGTKPDPKELHAYLIWKAVKDEEFYSVETTFLIDYCIVRYLKTPHRIDTMRNYIHYLFNESYSYQINAFRVLK